MHSAFRVDSFSISITDSVIDGCGQEVVSSLLLGPNVRVKSLIALECGIRKLLLVVVPPAESSVAPFEIEFETSSYVSVVDSKYSPDFGVAVNVQKLVLFNGFAPCHSSFSARIA